MSLESELPKAIGTYYPRLQLESCYAVITPYLGRLNSQRPSKGEIQPGKEGVAVRLFSRTFPPRGWKRLIEREGFTIANEVGNRLLTLPLRTSVFFRVPINTATSKEWLSNFPPLPDQQSCSPFSFFRPRLLVTASLSGLSTFYTVSVYIMGLRRSSGRSRK